MDEFVNSPIAPVDHGGDVYPETLATTNVQPMMPFVEIYIGPTKLTLIPPRYLLSFNITKLSEDGGSTFTLSLFDDNWEELEYALSRNQTAVSLRYGFVTGKQSPRYNLVLGGYGLDFTPSGTILNITGYTTGTYENLTEVTIDTETLNPTEAAKKICRAAGWQVFDENFEPSVDVESSTRESWALMKEKPATYIINKLAPMAVSPQGRGGYRFYLDDTTSPPTAYFRPLIVAPDTTKTYVYMKGIDSPVLDLSLDVEGIWGGTTAGELVTTGLSSSFIDPDTKEIVSAAETINSVRVDATGEYTSTPNSQYTSSLDVAGHTRSQAEALLRYYLSPKTIYPYSGTMVIVGDPEIHPTAVENLWVRIINITDNGNLHHSSGLYYIEGAADRIEDGIMTTTLSIKRTASLEGSELVEYKLLYK